MASADSDKLRNTHQYFGSREPTDQNDHTGRFEDYNLIFITAEAYSHYAVDPALTPTLHKMTHEGLHFTDFYNPVWGVSTSDGEYAATTGLIPKSGVWSMAESGSNSMPLAMGNQLRRLSYATFAYHNHTYDYYSRDISHPNLGYDYKGVGNGLEVARTWPESDVEMIDVTMPEVLQDEPFHAYYMTVSGHLEYNFGGNFIAAKNRDLVADLPYSEAGKAYLATQIELDRAMELLLERLEEAGVADRTLIVLSADHYPYGLSEDEIDDLAGHEVESNFELHKSSLIIYANGMEPETIDEPVSSMDIIPTISNLMGLEFDSRLLMGRDVFSGSDPLVIFNNRSFITDQGRYNALTREFAPEPGATPPDDYRQAISDEIDRRFYYSTVILDEDYYDLVLDR
nr:LTA synthase family protein [Ornithinimicrobium cryptoxanthini]